MILAMVMTHWHGDFNISSLSFFISFADIPLIVWYLSFYCYPQTKFVVVGKIINLAIANSAEHWAGFVEEYIYVEKNMPAMKNIHQGENISTDNSKGYSSSKSLWVVLCYQFGYILATPIIGKMTF